jgi:hypothetical protein
MTRPEAGRPGTPGPVLAGILTVASAEDVLRLAFDEADSRVAALRVVTAGLPPGADAELSDLVTRWAAKYPDIPVTVAARHVVDPAITLTAATLGCCLAVLPGSTGARAAAVVRAVARRASCPVTIVDPHENVMAGESSRGRWATLSAGPQQ